VVFLRQAPSTNKKIIFHFNKLTLQLLPLTQPEDPTGFFQPVGSGLFQLREIPQTQSCHIEGNTVTRYTLMIWGFVSVSLSAAGKSLYGQEESAI
jgi:hypothetical protein